MRVTVTDREQPFASVSELTEEADRLFQRFSSMCSATLIEHDWGFAKLPEKPMYISAGQLATHPIFPSGYTLVAQIEIIRRVFNNMPENRLELVMGGLQQALAEGIVGSMEPPSQPCEEPYRITDYPPHLQNKIPTDFAYGRKGKGFDNPNELYFVDIDPYVMSNNPNFVTPYTPKPLINEGYFEI